MNANIARTRPGHVAFDEESRAAIAADLEAQFSKRRIVLEVHGRSSATFVKSIEDIVNELRMNAPEAKLESRQLDAASKALRKAAKGIGELNARQVEYVLGGMSKHLAHAHDSLLPQYAKMLVDIRFTDRDKSLADPDADPESAITARRWQRWRIAIDKFLKDIHLLADGLDHASVEIPTRVLEEDNIPGTADAKTVLTSNIIYLLRSFDIVPTKARDGFCARCVARALALAGINANANACVNDELGRLEPA